MFQLAAQNQDQVAWEQIKDSVMDEAFKILLDVAYLVYACIVWLQGLSCNL